MDTLDDELIKARDYIESTGALMVKEIKHTDTYVLVILCHRGHFTSNTLPAFLSTNDFCAHCKLNKLKK